MVGTVKWRVKDDNGKIHSIRLPNTYYSPSVETRLLSPQHWAQVRGIKRDTYCVTYYDAIIMRWNKDKYQITAPLDDRKHRNVGVMRSISGIRNFLTSCQAFEERTGAGKRNTSHIKSATRSGEVVSVDQLESSIPGFIRQMTGKLTRQRIVGSTVYVDHASEFSFVYHQTSMSSEETVKSKSAFEKFADSHGVNIKHYHA
jgi:hypothetical protein